MITSILSGEAEISLLILLLLFTESLFRLLRLVKEYGALKIVQSKTLCAFWQHYYKNIINFN
jgi:hypothetical protein